MTARSEAMMRKKRLPWLLGAGVCCLGALALFACKDDGDTITEYIDGGDRTSYEYVTVTEYSNGATYSNIDSETGLPTSGGYDSTVRVHDPMTVYDSATGKYYVFGSHFAVASSEDLVHWTQEVDGSSSWDSSNTTEAAKLYDDGSGNPWWQGVLSRTWNFCAYVDGYAVSEDDYDETLASTWAPSVIKIDGKWYMYYSYTANTAGRSVIGRVSSDSILGPYSDNEIILVSQGTITTTYGNGPNCIDQEVFYDHNGDLHMVYGSWYGGIFLIDLEEDGTYAGFDADDIDPDGEYTVDADSYDYEGMTIEDLEPIAKDDVAYSYFWGTATDSSMTYSSTDLESYVYGKKLWHYGYSTGVEGPFIFYNDDTQYYYLMTSEGDLSNVYNMKIARAGEKNTLNCDYYGVNGSRVVVASVSGGNGGNKLAGNYKWADESTEYWALGHNSVIKKDNSSGTTEYFVVCHARIYDSSNHHLEVHQLYFNNEGWPVMSPNRYVGESLRAVDAATIAGSYDVIEHTVATSSDVAESTEYYFDEGGTIYTDSDKGTEAGSWALVDGDGEEIGTDDEGNAETSYYITVTLGTDDDSSTTYNGVVAPGWRNYNPKGVWCITATSDSGRPMWANQAD